MGRIVLTLLCGLLLVGDLYAEQSTITEAEGSACMGDDKSRKQTEQAALADAKRKAVEFASTYVKSETQVKNFALEQDLLSAYAHAEVKLLREPEKTWYKDASAGDCLKMRIKAEVVPDVKAMEALAKDTRFTDDPSAPLLVKASTDKKEYKAGEKIKIYLRGNKPFYARVVYRDAGGALVQLLPNPHRPDNYFNGGSVYEVPAGNDTFELEVSPPFGEENIIVYASTSPLGEIGLKAEGGVYQITTKAQEIGTKTRGIKLTGTTGNKAAMEASEFHESTAAVRTAK
ncbi:MAG TPA: DUF4384 domain-containing protein [Nitrospirota bacterium]|nr:DUF4384 domain-containing protein [Nitrospirota bacterium]